MNLMKTIQKMPCTCIQSIKSKVQYQKQTNTESEVAEVKNWCKINVNS